MNCVSGTISLAENLLQFPQLTELSLVDNKIGDHGAFEIARVAKIHPTLVRILMGKNLLHDAGSIALAEVFQMNGATELISIDRNFLSLEGEEQIGDILERCHNPNGRMDVTEQQEIQGRLLDLVVEEAFFDDLVC